MTYQGYISHLKVCEYLGKEPTGQYKKLHDILTELWDGMEIVVNSKNDTIVLQKKVEWFFEQDFKIGYMWCRHDQVWAFFQKDMGMKVIDTQGFIKSAVEEHLKCTVGTPGASVPLTGLRWKNTSNVRWEHPTPKAVSLERWVEEHLKCTVGTPSGLH